MKPRLILAAAALAGVQIARGGTADLREGEVSGCPIGVNLQTEGFDHYQATCGAPTGPEQALAIRIDRPSNLRLTVENNDYDTVLFVRAACDDAGTELGCNDDTNGLASEVRLDGLSAGTYFAFLDGYAGAIGHADVVVEITRLA